MAESTATTSETPNLYDAGLQFEATGVKLYFGAGKPWSGVSNDPRIIYSLKADAGELTLSTGENVEEMAITLAVTNRPPGTEGGFGSIYYLEPYADEASSQPAHIAIEVNTPDDPFRELLALARRGRYPSKIGVQVIGLKIGWYEAQWDTASKAMQKRAVSHVDFSFPLGGEAMAEAAEASGRPREQPITPAVVEELHARLQRIAGLGRWMLAALVAILVVLVFYGR
jgi:hypothetical protein